MPSGVLPAANKQVTQTLTQIEREKIMMSTVVVSSEKDIYSQIESAMKTRNKKICRVTSGAGALSLLLQDPMDLMIINETLSDMTARQLIEQVIKENSMVNCAVISDRSPEDFHAYYEGLGVLMQFSKIPDETDLGRLFEHVDHILSLSYTADHSGETDL